MNKSIRITTALIASAFAGSAMTAVTAEEAKPLGTTLTPWGAEIAGNKDGSIPAYDGKGSIGFKGAGWWVDKPWADTKFSPEAIAGEGIR